MEILRFGPGNRRPDGPPGTQGITGQVIWDDDRANVAELAFARQAFNDAVMSYNNKREIFPSNLLAGMFNFKPAALFETDDPQQRQAPQVSF